MKRLVGGTVIVLLCWFTMVYVVDPIKPVAAQIQSNTARHFGYGPSLPATCNFRTGDIYAQVGGSSTAYRFCTAANTWTAGGGATGASGPSGPSGPAGGGPSGTPSIGMTCGTGASLDSNATDSGGTINTTADAATCVLTFSMGAWGGTNPRCVVSSPTAGITVGYAHTATELTFDPAQLGFNTTIDYICSK